MPIKHDLPVLTNVQIRNFTLYRNRALIDIEIRPGVFCLAGANGLGKTTFLAAVNFAFTGIIASPSRTLRGVARYYRDSITQSRRFFDGRIAEVDRDRAEISLRFRIGRHNYHLTRNFFEPQSLRTLSITDVDGRPVLDTNDMDSRAKDEAYRQQLALDTRLGNFEYFVFLQHFLLTFDERRHALFWDKTATNDALFLAFGMRAEDTLRAEELRLAIDSADSNARNAQWQATMADNRLRALDGRDVAGEQELQTAHNQLIENADQAREEADLAERQLADASLKAAEFSARQLSLRSEYDQVFSKKLQGHRDPAAHPVLRSTLSERTCDICGSDDAQAMQQLEIALAQHRCPLCGSPTEDPRETDFTELERVDDELALARDDADMAQTRLERLRSEASHLARQAAIAATELSNFEATNSEGLSHSSVVVDEVSQQRRALEAEKTGAVVRRDEHRRRRDELRRELEPLTMGLAAAYREGELEFVPNFRRLAKRFIGLDLDISLELQKDMFSLAVQIQGIARRQTTELSESQRFFLDIALRMSLAQHMSTRESPAGMLIDTPEGSLDIAYEARAGDMFADFAHDGNNLVMTANINSSELLIRLAERCTADFMQLVRMTDWTALSEVQAQEEHLFFKAYAEIENALAGQAAHE